MYLSGFSQDVLMALTANSCQFSLKLFHQRTTVYSHCSFTLLAEYTVWGLCPWGADGQGKGTHCMVLSAGTLHCKRCLLHRQTYCLGQETLLGGFDFTVPDCSVLQSNLAIISYSFVNCDHGLQRWLISSVQKIQVQFPACQDTHNCLYLQFPGIWWPYLVCAHTQN